MGMTNFEFFAIVVFVMAVLGAMAWRQIKRTRDQALARMERDEEAARNNAARLKQEALDRVYAIDRYNEACNMEPFCGEGKKPVSVQERNAKAYEEAMGRWPEPIKLTSEQERQARSRIAVQKAQEAARAATRHAQRMHVLKLEKEYRAEQEQHNSSFRALGMTPVSIYPDQEPTYLIEMPHVIKAFPNGDYIDWKAE